MHTYIGVCVPDGGCVPVHTYIGVCVLGWKSVRVFICLSYVRVPEVRSVRVFVCLRIYMLDVRQVRVFVCFC